MQQEPHFGRFSEPDNFFWALNDHINGLTIEDLASENPGTPTV